MATKVTATPAALFSVAGIDFFYGERTTVQLTARYADASGNSIDYSKTKTVRTHDVAPTIERMRDELELVKTAVRSLGFDAE